MTYFKDLTPYEYSAGLEISEIPVLNVGWLGAVEFDQEETSPEFKARLLQHCLDENVVLIMRGFHACPFCEMSSAEWSRNHPDYGENTNWMSIGDGEIRTRGKSVIYAAPTLIYHYVTEHYYRPPQEFIDAVLSGPQPGSNEHRTLLDWYRKEKP